MRGAHTVLTGRKLRVNHGATASGAEAQYFQSTQDTQIRTWRKLRVKRRRHAIDSGSTCPRDADGLRWPDSTSPLIHECKMSDHKKPRRKTEAAGLATQCGRGLRRWPAQRGAPPPPAGRPSPRSGTGLPSTKTRNAQLRPRQTSSRNDTPVALDTEQGTGSFSAQQRRGTPRVRIGFSRAVQNQSLSPTT